MPRIDDATRAVGLALGRGRDAAAVLDELRPGIFEADRGRPPLDGVELGETFLGAVAEAVERPLSEWANYPSEVRDGLATLPVLIARATGRRFLELTVWRAVVAMLLEASPPGSRARLDDTELVGVELGEPVADVRLGAGAERALLDLRAGGRRVATTLVPALGGTVSASVIADVAAEARGMEEAQDGGLEAAQSGHLPLDGLAPRAWPPLPVLMYHRIGPPGSPAAARYATEPSAFEEQLAWLREHGYASIDVAEWAAGDGSGGAGRAVVLTFDDGYADFGEHAVPLLTRYGFRAELFVVSGLVGGCNAWEPEGFDRFELMDWAELAGLPRETVRIGAHTVTHPHLLGVSLSQAATELARSRAELSDRLARPIDRLAYPYGGCDRAIARVAGSIGFEVAYTTSSGRAYDGRDLLWVPRLEVRGGISIAEFGRLVTGRDGDAPGGGWRSSQGGGGTAGRGTGLRA